jgi:hypothetical protein
MRVRTTTGLLIALALMTGCSAFSKRSGTIQRDQATQTVPTANRAPVAGFASGDEYRTVSVAEEAEPVSLNTAQSAAQAYDRKIIQNAQLTIELDDPHAAQRQLAVIAQTHGGFIVASEATVQNTVTAPTTIVTVVMRVPAAQFTATLERIRGLGGHIPQDKTTGQDVTEEYIDLEARHSKTRGAHLRRHRSPKPNRHRAH